MASINSQITQASAKNAELLRGLSEVDGTPVSLAQQISYIADLNKQVEKTKMDIKHARYKTSDELKDHEKYRDSHVRRFMHKASGQKEKFAEKAETEEREYFDALQAQKEAEDRLGYLQSLLKEAEDARQELQPQAQRCVALQKELDALYNSIFAGATPDFPKEDEKESACKTASAHYDQVQTALSAERQVVNILEEARKIMKQTTQNLVEAHSASQMDMFGGGMISGMMKLNNLEKASSGASKVRMLVQQAQKTSQEVSHVGSMDIPEIKIFGDIMFDNIFSDMEMHDRIKQSESKLAQAERQIQEQLQLAKERVRTIEKDLKVAKDGLDSARKDLQNCRAEVFETVGNGAAPPAYSGTAPPTYST